MFEQNVIERHVELLVLAKTGDIYCSSAKTTDSESGIFSTIHKIYTYCVKL